MHQVSNLHERVTIDDLFLWRGGGGGGGHVMQVFTVPLVLRGLGRLGNCVSVA